MSTSVASLTTNFFPSAENGFSTTTSGSVSSGATTVGLASVAGYTNGEVVVFVIDPTDASKKQVFTGVMDTAGSQVTSVVWTAGTNQTHALGATVVDYATATHMSMTTKGILQQHKQSGAHSAVTADSIVVTDLTVNGAFTVGTSETAGGYLPLGDVPDTITANGNRSYDLVFNGNDLTDTVSPGMRLKLTRTVTAPTYAGGLLNGSSHYFTKTTPSGTLGTVTNNFTLMCDYEPTSYAQCTLAGRSDSTPNNMLALQMTSSGQIQLGVRNGGTANIRLITTYQSIPLNKKTHIAASWTGGTVVIYLDGISVPVQAAGTGGTAPTTAGTGGDWSIGRLGAYAGDYAPGYISNVAAFDAVLTASTIKSYMSQKLAGNETNCIGAWALNNNGTDDFGANNVTATGGVSYTNNRAPFTQDVTGTSVTAGTTNYAIITKASFSTNTTLTVQVPEGDTIPTSGGVSAVSYSTQKVPYGFPSQRGKWAVQCLGKVGTTQNTPTQSVWYNTGTLNLSVPIGEWTVRYHSGIFGAGAASGGLSIYSTLSTANNSESDPDFSARYYINPASISGGVTATRQKDISATAITPYYLNISTDIASSTNIQTVGSQGSILIEAANAYL